MKDDEKSEKVSKNGKTKTKPNDLQQQQKKENGNEPRSDIKRNKVTYFEYF